MGSEVIQRRPACGWTVHNNRGKRLGQVLEVRSSNRVFWRSDTYGHGVLSSLRWEDSPPGTYREPCGGVK